MRAEVILIHLFCFVWWSSPASISAGSKRKSSGGSSEIPDPNQVSSSLGSPLIGCLGPNPTEIDACVCVIFLAPRDPRPHMCSVYVLHASVASIG